MAGGKSRKSGGISKQLVSRIVNRNPSKNKKGKSSDEVKQKKGFGLFEDSK